MRSGIDVSSISVGINGVVPAEACGAAIAFSISWSNTGSGVCGAEDDQEAPDSEGESVVACTALTGVGCGQLSVSGVVRFSEKPDSGAFEEPQPNSERDRLCCHRVVRNESFRVLCSDCLGRDLD